MASAGFDQASEVHFRRGPCRIILKQGDLLRETNVDALVIPTPPLTDSENHNYALFNSICSTANRDLKREIDITREKVVLLKPQIIWKENSAYILSVPPYLGNPKKAEELLEKTYTSCLTLAMSFDVRKIAFPTIGCGVIGFRTSDAAKVVYRSLEKFELPSGTKLNEIRVIIYNMDVYGPFTQTFVELSQDNRSRIKFDTILDKSTPARGMGVGGDAKQSAMDDLDDNDTQPFKRSTLNPDAATFPFKTGSADRTSCRFLLSNKQTEIVIRCSDLTKEKANAIVNVENESMTGNSALNKAIHRAAGKELADAYRQCTNASPGLPFKVGSSRILLSYAMSKTTSYIITTIGPVDGKTTSPSFAEQLESCYKTSLELARLYDLETIAFPPLGCESANYPVEKAAEIALKTIDRESKDLREVVVVLSEQDMFQQWVQAADDLEFISLDKDRKPNPKRSVKNQAEAKEPPTATTDETRPSEEDKSPSKPEDEDTDDDDDQQSKPEPKKEAKGDDREKSGHSTDGKKGKPSPEPKKGGDPKGGAGAKKKDGSKKASKK